MYFLNAKAELNFDYAVSCTLAWGNKFFDSMHTHKDMLEYRSTPTWYSGRLCSTRDGLCLLSDFGRSCCQGPRPGIYRAFWSKNIKRLKYLKLKQLNMSKIETWPWKCIYSDATLSNRIFSIQKKKRKLVACARYICAVMNLCWLHTPSIHKRSKYKWITPIQL